MAISTRARERRTKGWGDGADGGFLAKVCTWEEMLLFLNREVVDCFHKGVPGMPG